MKQIKVKLTAERQGKCRMKVEKEILVDECLKEDDSILNAKLIFLNGYMMRTPGNEIKTLEVATKLANVKIIRAHIID